MRAVTVGINKYGGRALMPVKSTSFVDFNLNFCAAIYKYKRDLLYILVNVVCTGGAYVSRVDANWYACAIGTYTFVFLSGDHSAFILHV